MRRQRRCEAAEPGAKKRALVVHDSPLMRFGLISLVELHPLVSVCAEASHGPAACERCAQEEPGLIVLDLASARCDGLVLLRELRRIEPRAAVVVVIGCEPGDAMLAGRARRAGACACVSCRDEAAELLAAVEAALRGRLFASKRLAALLLAEAPRDTRRQAGGEFSTLSDRELQDFGLLGHGHGAATIARELGVSVKTVETHQQHLKEKLQLNGCADLRHRAECWLGQAA